MSDRVRERERGGQAGEEREGGGEKRERGGKKRERGEKRERESSQGIEEER